MESLVQNAQIKEWVYEDHMFPVIDNAEGRGKHPGMI
jgi:hypothetical protein